MSQHASGASETAYGGKAPLVLAIDQSTSGTKALLFGGNGELLGRSDRPHRQKISENGWVSHDPMEIWENTLLAVKDLLEKTEKAGVSKGDIAALGISNQRETAMVWNGETGLPIADAVVWHCARGEGICREMEQGGRAEAIREKSGLPLSPYFSAAKIAWILQNTPGIPEETQELREKKLCAGTMDSWLVYKLTGGKSFYTDCSNAARTQLFNIREKCWDEELCQWFGIAPAMLPQVLPSDGYFGETDLGGILPKPIPIRGVLGDSNGALFGQGCLQPGMIKTTYGTGSSVMMHVGEEPVKSENGLASSLAWGRRGRTEYVLEGNINYTGSVMKWITEDLGLLSSPKEAGKVAQSADPEDTAYLVPAFTGLGAPYWKSDAKAVLCGMTRSTGRAEIVKAAEECTAYQIADILALMEEESGIRVSELRVDGGPTRDGYLMQFQSDILGIPVAVPSLEELSGMGAAYMAGIAAGVYEEEILSRTERKCFRPQMTAARREEKRRGWKQAVEMLLRE